MGLEWQVISKRTEKSDEITELLRANWEPFTVYKGELWLKRQFFNEDMEPKSSTKPENANWAGKETTE